MHSQVFSVSDKNQTEVVDRVFRTLFFSNLFSLFYFELFSNY